MSEVYKYLNLSYVYFCSMIQFLLSFIVAVSRYTDNLILICITHKQEKPMAIGFPFLPTTDSASGGEVFLPAPPRELLDSGILSAVPMIAGVTSHEGILALNGEFKDFTDPSLSHVPLSLVGRFHWKLAAMHTKAVPVFNDASQYGDVWGSERTDPPILNLGTGRR
jgi:hypothetical protein